MKTTLSEHSYSLLVLVTLACIGLSTSGQDTSFLTNGLVAYWSFDEGQGTTAHDSSGYGNNGVIHSGAYWAEGKIGSSLLFFPTPDSFVQVPSSASLNVSTGLTIAAWVNLEFYADEVIVGKFNEYTLEPSYLLKAIPSIELSKSNLDPRYTAPDLLQLVLWGQGPAPGTWTHIAATFDSVTRLGRLYMDGLVVGEGQSSDGRILSCTADLLIGAVFGGNPDRHNVGENLVGLIDEVRIYSRGLSEAEVQMLYAYEYSLSLSNVAPIILSQSVATNLYVGDSAQLAVTAIGPWPLSYQWRKDGGTLGGKTNTTLTLVNVGLTDTGNYTVVVTNSFGSVTSAVIRVSVLAAGPPISLIKAVKPAFSTLLPGRNYQMQVSGNLTTWTNRGSPFTATDTSVVWSEYFDVDSWNSLFFRLQVAP